MRELKTVVMKFKQVIKTMVKVTNKPENSSNEIRLVIKTMVRFTHQ